MKFIRLGKSGLEISRICLGTMGFGVIQPEFHQWVINEENSRKIIKEALDLGINFFDTANVYSNGTSEEILGRGLKAFAKREEIVIATKVYFNAPPGTNSPNAFGLSRKTIFQEVEKSLARLQTDYIDLYIIHRWDYHTPIEETMEALNDLVRLGKTRYIGASAMYAWQFQKAQHTAEKNGWTKFISMQNHYNLIYREDERELIPYCHETGIGLTPYSPLASGRLAKEPDETSSRLETDKIALQKYGASAEADLPIIERVGVLSKKYGAPRSHISLSWILNRHAVAAPIVGATKTKHLKDAVEALSLNLAPEDMRFLEEPYMPHHLVGLIPYTFKES